MRKFFGVLCIILGLFTSVPVLVASSLRSTLLESAPWKASLAEARVYERALDELPVIIFSDPKSLGDAVTSTPLSAADMASVVKAVIPKNLLQQTVEQSLDLTFALIHGDTQWEQASLIVPLQDIKNRAPVEIQNVLVKKIQALPTCTDAQLKTYEQRKGLDGVLPPCKPKGVDVSALVRTSVPLQEIRKAIPESIDVIAEIRKNAGKLQPCTGGNTVQASAYGGEQPCQQPQDISSSITKVQDIVTQAFKYHLLLMLVSIAFFLGSFLIFLPNVRQSFRWLGVGVSIAGLSNLSLALEARRMLSQDLSEQTDQLGQALQSIMLPVARNLGSQLLQRYLLEALVMLLLGIIFFAVSYAWKPKPVK